MNGIPYTPVAGDFCLKGKAAIVVGGAGGSGEATARMYAKKGAKVAIVDCKDTCTEVAGAIAKDYGVQTVGVQCDVTSGESVDTMMKAVIAAFGEINILAAMPGFVDLYGPLTLTLVSWKNISPSTPWAYSGSARRRPTR